MQYQHVNPDEAWQIHHDVRAFNSIGIHWGTFKLSHEVPLCACAFEWRVKPEFRQHIAVAFVYHKCLSLHPFNGFFSRTTWVCQHQKGKPFWILMKQEMTGGCGI